jgi:superfamily II DNA or RNA helicase
MNSYNKNIIYYKLFTPMEVEQHIQRYTKYIHEDISSVDIDTATYKDHLHKIFEWLWCIILTKEYNSIFLRWEDIPPDEREKKGMMRDMGIDAWDMTGNRVVQMKCYNGLISWRCFSTFLACCSLQFKDAIKMLCRTLESSLQPLIQGGITNGDILDKTITDNAFRAECRRIQSLEFPSIESTENLNVRLYQEQAIYFTEKGKETNKNVYLSIPTGCGKTFIILQYHQRHLSEKMLVLVPTIVLLEQWGGECKKMGIHSYLIGTGHHHNLDDITDETIVICVYNSIVNIHNELQCFERYVVDEAHHIKTPERYMDNDLEFNDSEDEFEDNDDEEDEQEEIDNEEEKEDIEEQKPYPSYIRALADTKKVVYISATLDKPEDDSIFYEYSVRQAITEGYLTDYQFVFPIFEQDDVTNDQLAYYLVFKQHESHCIVYASSCEEGKLFQEQLNRLRPGCAGYIDANTPSSKRKRLFDAFESGHIRFLVNVRVLVEGFNAPHCRSIFFLHVSSNEVFVIQAIGRALRLHQDKTLATIYVPYTSENDLDRIQSFLAHLSTYDERIKASMDAKSIGGYIRLEKMEEIEETDEETDEDEKKDETLCGHRYNLVADSMGKSDKFEELWKSRLEEVKKFIDEHGKRPSSHSLNKIEKSIGNWLVCKTLQYNKRLMGKNVTVLWEEFICDKLYKQYMLSRLDKWIKYLEQTKDFISQFKKLPNKESSNIYEKKLGSWLNSSKKNYKIKSCILKDQLIRKKWEEFVTDEQYKLYFLTQKEVWNINLEQSKKYINENHKKPSIRDKDINIKKLCSWIDQQLVKYKNKTGLMDHDDIRLLWEEFINDEKYNQYVMSNEERFMINLDKCKKYIDIHKNKPRTDGGNEYETYLGRWLNGIIADYNKKRFIMKIDTLRVLWEEFISNERYKQFFLTNIDIWILNLEECKKYINENSKKPSTVDKNNIVKKLGHWITSQPITYRKNLDIMKNITIRKLWEDFIKDDQYKHYMMSKQDLWVYNLEQCKTYINIHKNRPPSRDKEVNIKYMGNWLINQSKNYKKTNEIMKDELIRQKWEEFITDEKYKQYFKK